MTKLWATAAWGVVERDARVFVTYRGQLASQVLSMLFQLTIFYYISHLLHAQTFASANSYFAFVVVGLSITQVLVTTLGMAPIQVRQELVAGTLERFLVSSFGVRGGIVAMMLFPTLSALLTAVLMLALAAAVFGLPLVSSAPLAIPIALLGAFAFMPFALLLVSLVIAFKQVAAGTQFVVSGVAIVGGLYFPTRLLPSWIRWAQYVQPFSPAADLLRHLLVGSRLQENAGIDILKVAGFGLVLFPLSLLLVGWAIRGAQRRGTICEY